MADSTIYTGKRTKWENIDIDSRAIVRSLLFCVCSSRALLKEKKRPRVDFYKTKFLSFAAG